jgi:hypothetical protein
MYEGAKIKNEGSSISWYQLAVKIKHFSTSKNYLLERKLFEDNFSNQSPSPRKWYFIELPL